MIAVLVMSAECNFVSPVCDYLGNSCLKIPFNGDLHDLQTVLYQRSACFSPRCATSLTDSTLDAKL